MEITPRPLVFFVCDDVALVLPPNCPIVVWEDPEWKGRPNAASVSTWYDHVDQAYRLKDVRYDALSIDVFFKEDGSDPAYALTEADEDVEIQICSGLYHGLAAMARRRTHDEHGNELPFAWEVRTVSPDPFLTKEQEIEVARAYGLIHALATPYDKERGFLGLVEKDEVVASPARLVLESFRKQDSRLGAGIDMIRSLLPRWRDRFLDVVTAHRTRIDVKALVDFRKSVSDRVVQNSFDAERVFDDPQAVVTIVDRAGRPSEAILLASIFADQKIRSAADFERIVAKWVVGLIEAGGEDLTPHIDDAAAWVTDIRDYLQSSDLSRDPVQFRQAWGRLSEHRRCLIFIAYYVAASLDRRRFRYPASQAEFCDAVGLGKTYSHIIPRLFQAACEAGTHVDVRHFQELQQLVLSRMSDPELQLPFSMNFMQSLAGVLEAVGLGSRLEKDFPALAASVTAGKRLSKVG